MINEIELNQSNVYAESPPEESSLERKMLLGNSCMSSIKTTILQAKEYGNRNATIEVKVPDESYNSTINLSNADYKQMTNHFNATGAEELAGQQVAALYIGKILSALDFIGD